MSSGKEIIDLTTSDSSSDESPKTSPPSSRPPYLPPYRPPSFGRRTKEQAKKFKHDINAPILKSLASIKPVSSSKKQPKKPCSSSRKPSYNLINELPDALTQALTQALKKIQMAEPYESSMKLRAPPKSPPVTSSRPPRTSQSSQPSSSTKPKPTTPGSRPVFVGLVAPRVWELASQSMGMKRTMPSCEDLIDAMSKCALDHEEEEQRKQHKNNKNKGKQPME